MNRASSFSNFINVVEGGGKIEVDINELYHIRQCLEFSMRLIDGHISQFSAKLHSSKEFVTEPEEATVVDEEKPKEVVKTKSPKQKAKTETGGKAKSLGICMFVNKRILKEQSIGTREELEACSQRCQNKAVHLKNGLLICSRHKDSDVSKLEEIVNGIKPQILTVDISNEVTTVKTVDPTESKFLPEGQYGNQRYSGVSDLEDAISECTHLERLLEDTSKIIPCRIGGLKECCLAVFDDVYYVVEPMGECYGKITDQNKIDNFELKLKTKEYFDISGSIEQLEEDAKDRKFIEHHSLTYTREFIRR